MITILIVVAVFGWLFAVMLWFDCQWAYKQAERWQRAWLREYMTPREDIEP